MPSAAQRRSSDKEDELKSPRTSSAISPNVSVNADLLTERSVEQRCRAGMKADDQLERSKQCR